MIKNVKDRHLWQTINAMLPWGTLLRLGQHMAEPLIQRVLILLASALVACALFVPRPNAIAMMPAVIPLAVKVLSEIAHR